MARKDIGRRERTFYIRLTDEERMQVRENMERLKDEHGISMSAVLRKVLLEHMNSDDFLRFIGVKE